MDVAIQSLQKFDLILTLDTLSTNPKATDCALSKVLGWTKINLNDSNSNKTYLPHENKGKWNQCPRRRKHHPGDEAIPNPEESEINMVMNELNALDNQLYKEVTVLERRILRRLGCL